MKAKKIYLQPSGIVYNGILDLMDAQNGRELASDRLQRTLHFSIMMFDMEWTLLFNAVSIDCTRCEVTLEVVEESTPDELSEELRCMTDCVLRREYAMLDAMLLIGTPLEISHGKAGKAT